MANRRTSRTLERLTFGGRMPWGIGLLISVTVVTSLIAAVGSRHVLPLFELGALVPDDVLRGQLWRLLTWAVLEPSPLSLLFACLLFWWFGRDLAGVWGSRRLLTVYFGVALVSSMGTCIIALFDPAIGPQTYVGSWPLAEAMTVAWGLYFPDRVIRIYFVIPIRGYWLAWGTIALTFAYAAYFGWDHFVPNMLAEGAMLAYLYRAPVMSRYAAWQRSRAAAAQKAARTRKQGEQRMASVHVLRKIEEKDDDDEPLSPEMERKLAEMLGRRKKKESDEDDDKNKLN